MGGVGCMWTNGKNAIKRTPRKLCVGVARQVQLQLQVAGRVPKEAALWCWQKCFGHFEDKRQSLATLHNTHNAQGGNTAARVPNKALQK